MFDQSRAAFDPVAIVAVEDAVDRPDFGGVDMATDDAVGAAAASFAHDSLLEIRDELHGALDLALEVCRERPVRHAEGAAQAVKNAIEAQRQVVGSVAETSEPLRITDHAVELVAVKNQIASAVQPYVDGLVADRDAAETQVVEVAEVFIMVAGDVDDPGALAGLAQDLLDDIVVQLIPVPVLAERPVIDKVADDVETAAVGGAEKIEKETRLRPPRSQMYVGDPDGPEPERRRKPDVHRISWSIDASLPAGRR
jgi:hypothetical protein